MHLQRRARCPHPALQKEDPTYIGAGIRRVTHGELSRSNITRKANGWVEELNLLADITGTQPHAAYVAFTHGLDLTSMDL